MKTSSHRRTLRRAAQAGSVVECAVDPYTGREVVYRPRNAHDSKPWVPADGSGYRYNGNECRVRDALAVNTALAGEALSGVVFEGDPVRVRVGFAPETLAGLKTKAEADRARYRAEMDARKAEQRRRFG